MTLMLGVDVGQRRESSGLCAAEIQRREDSGREVNHYVIRYLERIAIGTPYPGIVHRVGAVVHALADRTGTQPEVFVDATGLGTPIVTLLEEAIPGSWVRPVYFTYGDRKNIEGGEVRLGKAWLVTRLQTLLQAARLHLPRSPQADELAGDLLEYEIHVEPDANERYGAFRVGRHDDLVTALGLAVQGEPTRPGIF
jgi:hypothetical protein